MKLIMNNKFSENLKTIRKDNHLSQEQLAEELGVSRQAISKWESAIAYPEMDKIITISEKFNLNIDDLLHKDIKKIKYEDDSKKSLNKYTDDFLNFITNSINMFSNMTFKTKIKCLLEQFIIGIILFIIFLILGLIFNSFLYSILYNILPNEIYYIIISILKSIYCIFAISVSIIILLRVYKTRYLDYFENIKTESNKEQKEDLKNKATNNIDIKNKFLFKNNEKKIIIRDPKHSEYKFMTIISKFIIITSKFFSLCFSFAFFTILITLSFMLILSFLIYKTGIFFIGTFILITSLLVITIICIVLILNFIFNRKNNKRLIIWSSIISLLSIGIGCGLISIGLLDFEYVENPKTIYKTDYIELEMDDNLFLDTTYYLPNNIEYIESNNSNIKIEYTINKYYDIYIHKFNNNGILLGINYTNPIKIINYSIKELNNKKIISITNNFKNIKVYTTKQNIDKLQKNKKLYDEELNSQQDLINFYEEQLNELQEQINNYNEKEMNYEQKINDLQSKLYELEEQ